MTGKPLITNYQSVLLFLQDLYVYRKDLNAKFSYALWAQELGVKNRVYLRSLVLGERPINEKHMHIFAIGLGFDARESEYFYNLVGYNQSKTARDRQSYAKNLLRGKLSLEDFKEVSDQYDFLSDSLLPLLLTALSFEDTPQDTNELAETLKSSKEDIESGLVRLEELKLVERRRSSGNEFLYSPVKRSWRAPDSFKNLHLREFYRSVLNRAQEAIDIFASEDRRFRNLFVAMSKDEFKDFLGDFEVFVQEQLAKRNVDRLQKRRLYYLNFNFFPGSEVLKKPDLEV